MSSLILERDWEKKVLPLKLIWRRHDQVDWGFLAYMLRRFGFGSKWRVDLAVYIVDILFHLSEWFSFKAFQSFIGSETRRSSVSFPIYFGGFSKIHIQIQRWRNYGPHMRVLSQRPTVRASPFRSHH